VLVAKQKTRGRVVIAARSIHDASQEVRERIELNRHAVV
jgi:hypothetical protein